jgi:hypothetical protein
MDGIIQAQQLAERLRKARRKAWLSGLRLTSEQAMEQMFRNGSDRKPNPWYHGPKKPDTSSIRRDSADSPLVTLR